MVTVSGRLLDFVEDPSNVAQVQVRAREVRPHGDGVMLDHPVKVDYAPPTGTVTFDAAAGTAGVIMWHAVGRSHASGSLPLVVPDGATATLRECVEAALLADEGTLNALERLALEVTGMVATLTDLTQLEEWADSAKQDATTATSAATTAQEIATNLPATIQNELDDRVPPEVAEALSTDQTIRDAATLAINDAVDAGLPGKADTTYVDAQDTALGQRITDEKWWRGTLGASDSLDGLRGNSAMGLYRVTTGVGGNTGLPGWVEVTYDSNSARTRQVFTASSPADSVSLERKYSGGSWGDWTPVTWHGVIVSSGSADDLLTPHVYGINSPSVANLPDTVLGSLETLPAGSGLATLSQRFTSSEGIPRTWVRARRANAWSGWVRLTTEQDVEATVTRMLNELDISSDPPPLTMETTETPSSGGSVIVQSMSDDGVVGYNALSPTVRQTFDKGVTWEDVETFAGNNVEWVRALPSGELMVETSGWVDGEAGVRRVWVSTGYDRHNPTAATWAVTLTAAAPLGKFADWSISITDDMILLAEYGPKSGMVWGSGTEPIGEGLNARYIYKSVDGGYTWETIFDLNQFLLSNGRTTADRQHLHGVAWDKWWGRIWVTFGDASGDGTNGVVYSDDEGATWQAAYWTHTHVSQGWQVVGIQPMQDVVLFAGDMTPSGLIALDRAEGRDAFNFYTAWDFSETEKHLCHVIRYSSGPLGEIAMFAFAREGSASPSFIVGTRDGREFVVLWQESGTSLPGIRSLAGPSADGTVIAAHNTSSGWVEVSGRLHVTGSPWVPDGVPAVQKQVDGLVDALEAKADTTYVDDADIALGSRIDAEKWYRPLLRSGDTLDDKRGADAVGVYPVTAAVTGLPTRTAGWVEVFYNPDTSSTTQRFFAASWAVSGEWEREYWAGSWREWRDTSMQTAIAEKAPLVHEHTVAQITDLHHYSGTGFPEGKVTAPVGATYVDTAATNGAIRWVKASGTGNTGWEVEYGDTGWRNITHELIGTVLGMGTGAKVLLRRKLYDLEVIFVGPITLTASWGAAWETSQGFRPEGEAETALGENARLRLGRYNARIENATRDSDLVASGRSLFTTLPSEIDWPSTLPGTPE